MASILAESPNLIGQVFAQLNDAMAYAHSKGVFHMDINPSNILVSGIIEQNVKNFLIDWGCSLCEG